MTNRSIFLIFYSILCGSTQFTSLYTLQAAELYKTIIVSKTMYETSSNNSADGLTHLKSFNSFFKVNGTSYYFLPESIGYASYDHPQAIDLTKYNQSCLKSWAKKYNNSIDNCLASFSERTMAAEAICKEKKPDSDDCDVYKKSDWECLQLADELGEKMNEIVFPDGRSVGYLVWNCPSDMTCSKYGCTHRYSAPIYSYLPIATTRSPLESARDILSILLKVCIISSVVCALLSFFIRYYAYLHKRTKVQNEFLSQCGPTPPKTDYTSFPPPSMSYHPSAVYQSNPISEPPPPYLPPPPYTERPVEPLPRVA